MTPQVVRVICGPTGGGKSALAMQLAARHRIAIISADSRQIYRRFDIGTAKPTREDRACVTHYGIDIVEPTERYSAAQWSSGARKWIQTALGDGKIPIVVGGTGLYIKALFEPLSPVPSLDPARRAELEPFLAARTTEELREWCARLDPARAHLGKTQLIRAIETVLLTGKKISGSYARIPREEGGPGVSQSDSAATRTRGSVSAGAPKAQRGQAPETPGPTDSADDPNLTPLYLLVDPKMSLQRRIETRVTEMLERSWLNEVEQLSQSLPDDAPAWKSAGYRAMRDVVQGAGDLSLARERVIIDTRQYAKRQRTWFRHQLPPQQVTFFDPEEHGDDVIQEWWRAAETTETRA